MKIWLDDIRLPPDGFVWCKTANEAIQILEVNFDSVEFISFSHDLGGESNGTGYDVAAFIESTVYIRNKKTVPGHEIHSANPTERRRIEMAMKGAKRKLA